MNFIFKNKEKFWSSIWDYCQVIGKKNYKFKYSSQLFKNKFLVHLIKAPIFSNIELAYTQYFKFIQDNVLLLSRNWLQSRINRINEIIF